MPRTIYLSEIKDKDAFDTDVLKYIARLKAFNFEKGKPRPTPANPLIENVILRIQTPGRPDDYRPDYEVIDDVTPPPAPNEIH